MYITRLFLLWPNLNIHDSCNGLLRQPRVSWINLFVPVKSPYYPDGYNKEGSLTPEEFKLLHEGGAGPLYIKVGEGQYEHATEYDYDTQYYRNMNSLMSLLAVWSNTVKKN